MQMYKGRDAQVNEAGRNSAWTLHLNPHNVAKVLIRVPGGASRNNRPAGPKTIKGASGNSGSQADAQHPLSNGPSAACIYQRFYLPTLIGDFVNPIYGPSSTSRAHW
jgi:hypothetical protein